MVRRAAPGNKRLRELAAAYFAACAGEPARDENGAPLLDKTGRPLLQGARPPTPAGLAYALGFASVEEMTAFEGPEAAARTVRRALLRCRVYAEERLFDKDSRQGAEFTLKTYFGASAAAEESGECGVVILPAAESGAEAPQ